jgi:hypothetical protein
VPLFDHGNSLLINRMSAKLAISKSIWQGIQLVWSFDVVDHEFIRPGFLSHRIFRGKSAS